MEEAQRTAQADSVTGVIIKVKDGFASLMRGEVSEATLAMSIKAGTALLLLIVTYFAARLISRWAASLVCTRVDMTLGRFLGKVVFYSSFTVAGLAILQTAGMSISSFAALLAAAGFAIGLAFQGTLSNFASGILLLVFRPFKVGDIVNAAGVMGKIYEIDLFTTIFDTPDNRRLIVPNSSIAGTTIENISYHRHRRVDVLVGVAYASSLDETRAVLTSAAEALSDKMIPGHDRGFQILLSNLSASSVDWTVRFWAATEDFFAVKELLTAEIKRRLDDNDIQIPFPQMQLHLSGESEQARGRSLPRPKMQSQAETLGNRVRPRARSDRS